MLDIHRTALVLIDLQEVLSALMYGKDSLINNAAVLIRAFQVLQLPIVSCRQYPKALGDFAPGLRSLLADSRPIDKLSFSCCGSGEFNHRMDSLECSHVVLCGIETHVCVYQTAVELLEKGFNVETAADAVSSRTPENREIGLERIKAAGGIISSTEMIIFELLRTAEHPKFKEISKLVK